MDPDVPPRTWRRLQWAWKLLKATRSDDTGDYELGLQQLDEASRIKALYPAERVLRAKLLLRSQRDQEAQTLFASLRKELDESENPDLRYLRHYCNAMLALIRLDFGHVHLQAKLAQSLPCKQRLRYRFPLRVIDEE